MHHLSGIFTRNRKSTSMNPKSRVKPRLERCNAAKNIDYDATSVLSSLDDSPSSSLVARSLNFLDRSSFRIEGTEGELDLIWRSLGLSGPDDFAIPAEAWEALKLRSASEHLPRSIFSNPTDRKEARVLTCELTRKESTESVEIKTCNKGGGIKGVRPPLLKPPPLMRLPAIDHTRSTWEIVSGFLGESEGGSGSRVIGCEEEGGEGAGEQQQHQHRINESLLRITEGVGLLSESCSFSTSNDDDTSSTTTEPMSTVSPNVQLRMNITNWQKGDLLGSGSFGSVYEGISAEGIFFAVKEVSLLDQGSQGRQSIFQLEQEFKLLSQFEHENIVQYLGTDKDESKLYIFLELVTKGSLQKLYQKYHLGDSQVSAYTRQILHGLKYLHDRNVVHRDIKCANILVDASGSVKLADFGLAKATKLNDVKSCKGTAFWMAPEVVNRKNQGYGLPADIWSLGCTVLEMLNHQIPYYPLEWMQAVYRIGQGIPPPLPDSLSEDALDFINQCLQAKPNHRPTAVRLLDHPFVKRPLPAFSVPSSPYRRS